jgi:hypothetical protein
VLLALLLAVADDPFTSADGKFQVKFPGKPKTEAKTLAVGDGRSVPVTTTKATTRELVYAVVVADYPPELTAPAAKRLDGARDNMKGRDGVLKADKAVSFGPHKLPAREVTVRAGEKGKNGVRAVLIADGDRLYIVQVAGTWTALESAAADEFLNSFAVVR